MIIKKLTTEFEEMKRFINFVERTNRLQKIEEIDRYHFKKTPECIHILENFSSTATENHEKKANHLKRLDNSYKSFREHALKCERCQHSLDAIFTFTGYENKILFPEIIKKILEKEWKHNSDKNLYLCKLPAPGFNYSELTYISPLSLTNAVEEFRDKIRTPLALPKFSKTKYRKKKSNKGLGLNYFQAYLYPLDNRYKTKISIRSREK